MSGRPSDVEETSRQLIDSGIAGLMLQESHQSHLPNDPALCLFWVEVSTQGGEDLVWVYVEYRGKTLAFRVLEGEAFGTYGCPPLDNAKMSLVEKLAASYKLTNASA